MHILHSHCYIRSALCVLFVSSFWLKLLFLLVYLFLDRAATFGTHVELQGIHLLLLNASLGFILFTAENVEYVHVH